MVATKSEALQQYNTFGMQVQASRYLPITSLAQLKKVVSAYPEEEKLVLGGGSNILFTKSVEAILLHNQLMGIEIKKTNAKDVIIEVGGGVLWHDLVLWAVAQDLGGLENLSLIPGTVGASPIQNIGAYGVELKDCFVKLKAISLQTGKSSIFTKAKCQFGYRDSVFKQAHAGVYFIASVWFRLTRPGYHEIKTAYGDIQKMLSQKGISKPTIKDVSDAVIHIRQSKLPDPKVIGNAGSFFKNPSIPQADYDKLKTTWPEMPGYPQSDNTVKVPAGWLIEKAGWKGFRDGDAGCHALQALVLVNYGQAKGKEIVALSKKIMASVHKQFGIVISPEVNVW